MSLTQPPGFEKHPKNVLENSQQKKSNAAPSKEHAALKSKKAYEMAYSVAKNIPMQGLMLWMSGSGIQIFSMSITVMLLYNPIKAILSLNTAFKPFEGADLLMPKIIFVLLQLANMAMGVWKCWSMGLLPASSDWLSGVAPSLYQEISLQ